MKLGKILAEKTNSRETIYKVPADCSIIEAGKKFCELRIGALLVHETQNAERYLGIISEKDIIKALCCHDRQCNELTVADCMTRDMIIATVNDNVNYVMGIMARHDIKHIPIMDGKIMAGIISFGDILRCLNQDAETRIQYLNDYLGGTYKNRVY